MELKIQDDFFKQSVPDRPVSRCDYKLWDEELLGRVWENGKWTS